MKVEISLQIFEESLNIKFHQIPSIGSRVFPCYRQTDGQPDGRTKRRIKGDEVNSRFSQFCEKRL